ncbi:MAG: M50 family metallopeptidase [Actinomycetes bacterium]|jgi:regulator of sigma E protease|nr:M50 family metallopeptidase [Actinomycetes bacterium]
MNVILPIFWGIITLSLIVVAHEGGHALAARAVGLEVSEFMIGLPGPSITKKIGRTTFGITAIPFGGYVRVPALEGEAENGLAAELGAGELSEEARAVPAWKRIVVLSAGVVVNLVLALTIFTLVLTLWGVPTDRGYLNPQPDAPAARAGVRAGDKVVSIDGKAVADFDALVVAVDAHKVGEQLTLVVSRAGRELPAMTITLARHPDADSASGNASGNASGSADGSDNTDRADDTSGNADDPTTGTDDAAYLGVSPRYVNVRLSLPRAAAMSFNYLTLTARGILNLFRPSTFSSTVSQSSSVIGIAVIAADAAAAGPMQYATLIAAISLSLGLMNILPIPPLDGGKILIEIIQLIIRRPLKQNIVIGVSLVGFGLLAAFMVFVMYNDIARLFQ